MMTNIETAAVKGFFAGSGMDAFGETAVVDRLLALTGHFDAETKALTAPVRVAYIGTATYDIPKYRDAQTKWFLSRGCTVGDVCVADPSRPPRVDSEELEFLRDAHVVLVSGGNTLYAVRRWEETGLDACLRAAAVRGAVLAGGSAGAICWFSAGHSDSADPSTFAQAMLREAQCGEAEGESHGKTAQASTNENVAGERNGAAAAKDASWDYIRVHGLSLLPGLLCPHHDKRESNGVLRAEDFDKMLKRHPTERGIGIDHWAALVLPGNGTYEVFAVPGKTCGSSTSAAPAVYVKDVVGGQVCATVLQQSGEIGELLRPPNGPVVRDPFEGYFAMLNPTAKTEKLLCRSK